jgi:arsenate reductase (glutaredoxin)
MRQKPVLYHNPRCSKSRETLALLLDRNVSVEVVEYLESPPTKAALESLAAMLGDEAQRMVRTKEPAYVTSGLDEKSGIGAIAEAIAREPILLERPILVVGERAAIGRPPENVLKLID